MGKVGRPPELVRGGPAQAGGELSHLLDRELLSVGCLLEEAEGGEEEAELGPGFGKAAIERLVRVQLIGCFVEAAGGDQVERRPYTRPSPTSGCGKTGGRTRTRH